MKAEELLQIRVGLDRNQKKKKEEKLSVGLKYVRLCGISVVLR